MTQWNQMTFPQDGGGGSQVYPGSGSGGGTLVYSVPAQALNQAMANLANGYTPSIIASSGRSTSHSRKTGHHATRKAHTHTAKIWHAPAHPSRKKSLPEGIEDQPF